MDTEIIENSTVVGETLYNEINNVIRGFLDREHLNDKIDLVVALDYCVQTLMGVHYSVIRKTFGNEWAIKSLKKDFDTIMDILLEMDTVK